MSLFSVKVISAPLAIGERRLSVMAMILAPAFRAMLIACTVSVV
nr:hypothetical protein [Aliamphritea spongicola]